MLAAVVIAQLHQQHNFPLRECALLSRHSQHNISAITCLTHACAQTRSVATQGLVDCMPQHAVVRHVLVFYPLACFN